MCLIVCFQLQRYSIKYYAKNKIVNMFKFLLLIINNLQNIKLNIA